MHLEPDTMMFYTLDSLKRPARNVDWDTWGVHEHGGNFWIGHQSLVDGKDALRLPLLDILEKRDEEYPDQGDEEVYVLFGIDGKTGAFKWFLLSKEEFKRNEERYGRRL